VKVKLQKRKKSKEDVIKTLEKEEAKRIIKGVEDISTLRGLKEKERDFIHQVAFEVAKRYAFSHIKTAITAEDSFGVHGWLQINFPKDYKFLINNDVLDKACLYAKQQGRPEVKSMIKNVDVDKYKKYLLIIKKKYFEFKLMPGIRFDACYALTPEPFDSALHWHLEDPYELDGFYTKARVGPGNWEFGGLVTWDRPLFILMHAPGKDKGVSEAVAQAKDIAEVIVTLQEKIIFDLRNRTDVVEKKIAQREEEGSQWEDALTDLEKDRYVLRSQDRIARYRKEGETEKKEIPQSAWRLLGFTILGIIAIIIVFLIMDKLAQIGGI